MIMHGFISRNLCMPQIHASNSHKFMVCLCSPFKYVHSKNQVLKYTIYEIRLALMTPINSTRHCQMIKYDTKTLYEGFMNQGSRKRALNSSSYWLLPPPSNYADGVIIAHTTQTTLTRTAMLLARLLRVVPTSE